MFPSLLFGTEALNVPLMGFLISPSIRFITVDDPRALPTASTCSLTLGLLLSLTNTIKIISTSFQSYGHKRRNVPLKQLSTLKDTCLLTWESLEYYNPIMEEFNNHVSKLLISVYIYISQLCNYVYACNKHHSNVTVHVMTKPVLTF